jgi:transcriptional regulator with XRE-family HTH domain
MELAPALIGQKIKKLRELKNFTQSHMATELGITQSAYSKIEQGETEITYAKMSKIAEVLGISPEDIAAFNEQMIFNVMHNQTGNGFVIQKGISDKERELYEKQISILMDELTYLKSVLDKVLVK